MNSTVRIALVDDHRLFTEGFSALLTGSGHGYEVSTFEDPVVFLEALSSDTRFDLIILDLVMKGMNGLALLSAIPKIKDAPPVLMLSGIATPPPVSEMQRLGASGFVSKSSEISVLQHAVTRILDGGKVFQSIEATQAVADDAGEEVWTTAAEPPNLAPRQLAVLKMLGEGATNKAIAEALNISENTVKSHLRSIFEGLGVRTRTACVHKAVLLGLI
ncbi:response regulator transcription factor [Hyphobacterium sp. CCMP332]|uniref:response regulator transcription factor n=1 Tax=Hyphobacterium sp. CCMP332 TaxID=2749086 RepID=UPI00164FE28F|nr:response regulator transcription factor [Hyphobacterium sp. CCMP332]QNL18867.1 response regulator transcription factor [Hyphobacterium sp. CCMP332]